MRNVLSCIHSRSKRSEPSHSLTLWNGSNASHAYSMKNADMTIADVPERHKARFWERVDKGGPIHPTQPELGQCWLWIKGTWPFGYGRCRVGRERLAHRAAFLLTHGTLPSETPILHSCDNPPCCNPAHLRIGTKAENTADKVLRDRCAKGLRHGAYTKPESRKVGEKNGRAKLSENDVLEIRARYAAGGVSYKELAPKYGVSRSIIAFAVQRRTWRHIP